MKSSGIKKIFKEPLIHFLLLGLAIFLIAGYVQRQHNKADCEIVIDNNAVMNLVAVYQTQMGVMPSQKVLQALIDNYINDEIYFREAEKADYRREMKSFAGD